MKSLATAFQLSIYGMMLLSCLMLAFAEGTAFPQAISVPLVVLAWLFTERFHVLRLPAWGANALGFAAFGLALLELLGNSIEGRLLSGAHLLVYLSWIVLFQEKSIRHYWWMCALSVLQVAVGSVLTTSGAYGLLLFTYFCGAIWTLSVFSLWQTQESFREDDEAPAEEAGGAAARAAVDHAPYAVLRRPSQARGMLHVDPDARWLGLRFALGSGLTAACSMFVAAGFFLFIPRLWVGSVSFGNEHTPPGVRSLTGFTEKVRLGDIGRIMESTEPVLVIKLFDHDTDAAISIEDYARKLNLEEPLFRGAVLAYYDRGDWTTGNLSGRLEALPNRPPDDAPRVRQEITMQPIGTEILLGLHPVSEGRLQGASRDVGRYRRSSVLAHFDKIKPRAPQTYFLYSRTDIGDSTQPFHISELPPRAQMALREQYLQLPAKGLGELRKEARRVAGVEGDHPRPPDREMADRLVHWLRDSGQFAYTLDSSIQNRDLDPVEDFLLVRRQGHCEYYASALALMLRSVGIPSRMVSGFKGGKVNRITGAFEVEQRHAHAWVEALIDNRWETLDATPAAPRLESVGALEPQLPTFHDFMTFARETWSQYVVNMNIGHQRDRLYAPFQDLWAAVSDAVIGGGGKGKRFSFRDLIGLFSSGGGAPALGIRLAVLVIVLALTAVLVWGARRLWGFLMSVRQSGLAGSRAARRRVEFYERFRRLCASAGLARADGETQREFGRAVNHHWEPALASSGLHGVPGELTELFYRVRFGDEPLSEDEVTELDETLGRLEAAVRYGPADRTWR